LVYYCRVSEAYVNRSCSGDSFNCVVQHLYAVLFCLLRACLQVRLVDLNHVRTDSE
jgi:hypothetical protein